MLRVFALSAAAVAVSFTAFACSDNNTSSATPGAASSTSTAAATATSSTGAGGASAPAAAATPACSSAVTPSQTEGPYFKSGSPAKISLLEPGMAGTKLTLSGFVVTKSCKPVANATIEFWQADAAGNYDNSGYRLRGHLSTDDKGAFKLETIVPGEYPGRTEHIHFKVIVPGKPALTSQLYFPDVARNTSDGIFDAKLLLNVKEAGGAVEATYTIVLDMP